MQYEHGDILIVTGQDIPDSSQTKNFKVMVNHLLAESGIEVDLNVISIQSTFELKTGEVIIFKLCHKDLVSIILNVFKQTKPFFYVK